MILAVECNPGSPGTATQLVLQQLGYNNFYMWHRPHAASGGYSTVYGWWTTPATRPLLINVLREYLSKEDEIINSPYLVEEMGSFVKTLTPTGRVNYAAFEGYHDDRLMALAIGLYIAHEMDTVNVAEDRRRAEEKRVNLKDKKVKHDQLNQLGASMAMGESVESLWQRVIDSAEALQ